MRFAAAAKTLAVTSLITAFAPAPASRAAEPYCPNPAHARPAPVPPDLIAPLARTFDVDIAAVRGAAFVRCAGATIMGCYVGANLVCDQADTSRSNPGASAWCRAHPGSAGIPMAATGHATIYEWSCQGNRAVAGTVVMPVDADGYVADNWKEIR